MNTLIQIILSTFLISLISFIGVVTLSLKEKKLQKIILVLVALSAGALIGGAFIHLIPESIQDIGENIFIYTLIGFSFFFLIEKILHWKHCHKINCKIHSFAYMSLIGDAVHNLIDGLIIGASFTINTNLGIATTIAIAFHEIPQELGDFAVLIHGGFTKKKALIVNFLSAITAILGGIISYFLANISKNMVSYLLPIAAGGFIYISASDLIPELRKETKVKKAAINFIVFIIGISLMFAIKFLHLGH
jgi:zinc and cadmium transporter